MLSAILGIFIWSLVAPIVARGLPHFAAHFAGWVLAVVPAVLTFWFASFMMSVSAANFATNPR
jgi:multicomponent Na+:H+ antiporter subunit A